MKKEIKSPFLRTTSAALCAALTLSSWGPGVSAAVAQTVSRSVPSVNLPSGSVGLGANLGSPSVHSLPLASPLNPSLSLTPSALATPLPVISAAPSLIPAQLTAPAAAKAAAAPAKALPLAAVPSALEAVKPAASGETFGQAAAQDFSARITGETLIKGRGDASAPVVAGALSALTPRLASPSAADQRDVAPARTPIPSVLTKPEGQRRGAFFPLWLAGFSGLVWGVVEAARWGAHAFTAANAEPSTGATALAAVAIGAMALTGAFVLHTLVESVVFLAAIRRGRDVSDSRLRDFLRAEVLEGRLDGNAAALVRAYRPDSKYKDFTFAFASRGHIWVRPELVATPWLMRVVLLHELHHMRSSAPRGPRRAPSAGCSRTSPPRSARASRNSEGRASSRTSRSPACSARSPRRARPCGSRARTRSSSSTPTRRSCATPRSTPGSPTARRA
ncbi:MAG: hypothetical protein M0D55_16370 [Elusimicrobiota bacterium]|nr:MAG: hypothetical protein M0D55_16370 [Elusimicrobiota bacterium]